MSYFMVDIEADGPIPGDFSMIALGVVVVKPGLKEQFSARIKPISKDWNPKSLAVSGYTREDTLGFSDPQQTMQNFVDWIERNNQGRTMFVSDNTGFDWMFVCWYLHHFVGHNPFGHSSTHLGSLYKGLVKDCFQNFKHLRQTLHSHDPLDDALGNAEALLKMKETLELKIRLD